MGQITVTSATLRSKAEELNKINEAFRKATDELKQTEVSLRGEYEGEASEALQKVFEQDSAQWQNFYNEIAKYAQNLLQIADSYEKTEQANVAIATTRS